ncbi:MAG: glycosyltransferase family 4 protein [Maricaulaceae bacterium]
MKVLQVLPALGSGGVERTTFEMVQALKEAGHDAHVASAGGRLEGDIAELGGQIHILPLDRKNPLILRAATGGLKRIIKEYNIDIVHARSRAPAFPAYWAVKAMGVKFVTTYHGVYNAKSSLKRRYNSIMTRGDHIIANSEFTKAHIIKEHGTAPDKITTIPRGVDLALFPLEVDDSRIKAIRDHWGVGDDERVLLLPGRLTRWKGQAETIKAMKGIDDLTLVIQGDAQGRDEFVSELKRLTSLLPNERVKIVGPHHDMAAAYRASFCALNASPKPEAFGRVTAEAGAMGIPVIATAHGGSLEITDYGKTALLAIPGDVESLHTQIKTLAAMGPDQAQEFAKAGQIRARTLYTKRAMCDSTLNVYRQMLDLK